MIEHVIDPSVEAWGERLCSLESAAYVVRKYAIDSDDADARRLVRLMRDAETAEDACAAEELLRSWLATLRPASGIICQFPQRAAGRRASLRW